MATRDNRLRHTFSTERFLARLQSNLFSFHQEEAVARRSEATPKQGRRSALKTGHKGCTKRRFITFYGWTVKPPTMRLSPTMRPPTMRPHEKREAQPRITWNIGATRFSQPMVTCQNRLKTIGPIQMGVHEYQANARSGAKRRRKERPASQGKSNQSRGI